MDNNGIKRRIGMNTITGFLSTDGILYPIVYPWSRYERHSKVDEIVKSLNFRKGQYESSEEVLLRKGWI